MSTDAPIRCHHNIHPNNGKGCAGRGCHPTISKDDIMDSSIIYKMLGKEDAVPTDALKVTYTLTPTVVPTSAL